MGERAVRKRPIVAFLIQLLLAIRLRFTRRTRLEVYLRLLYALRSSAISQSRNAFTLGRCRARWG